MLQEFKSILDSRRPKKKEVNDLQKGLEVV
jgi:hypothetical protein